MSKKGLIVGVIVLFLGIIVIPSVIGDNPIFLKTIYVDDDGVADYTKIQDAIDSVRLWNSVVENYHSLKKLDDRYNLEKIDNEIKSLKKLSSDNSKILYVGGSGPGNYSSIQDAINESSDGDTVFVYRGTYIENLCVNKSIVLIGEDRDTTIIDGSEKDSPVWISTIIIRANSVNVKGFTILNEKAYSCGIFIGMNYNENVIVDNNIIFPWKGIWLWESRNNIIKENIISDTWDGIYLEGSEDNVITDNILFTNGISGISLEDANNNIITGCFIRKNLFGIVCSSSNGNKISGNNIDSNEEIGVVIEYSILNIISANNIINNTLDAYFFGFRSLQNRWDNNYWGKKYLIKPILGEMYIPLISNPYGYVVLRIPLVKFDKHPVKEPYDIPGMS